MNIMSLPKSFGGAVLDKRGLEKDRIIALLYHRLGATEHNLVWSITAKLKDVGYLSEYNPFDDQGVITEMRTLL